MSDSEDDDEDDDDDEDGEERMTGGVSRCVACVDSTVIAARDGASADGVERRFTKRAEPTAREEAPAGVDALSISHTISASVKTGVLSTVLSAKWFTALAVGATAVVAPYVMRTSSGTPYASLALGSGRNGGVRARELALESDRDRYGEYGERLRAMEATAKANVAVMRDRLGELEEELRRANEELEQARAEAKSSKKTRKRLMEAQAEASEASAREAATKADRDAVWKALRGQLEEAAKARAEMETEAMAVTAELEQAKAALERMTTCGDGILNKDAIDELRASLAAAENVKTSLEESVEHLRRQLNETSTSKSIAEEQREALREEAQRIKNTLAAKESRLTELESRLHESEDKITSLSKELDASDEKLREASKRAKDVESKLSYDENKFTRELTRLQEEMDAAKRRANVATSAMEEAEISRDVALEELRLAQADAVAKSAELSKVQDMISHESSAEKRRLEDEHAKLALQLNRAEAALSEYIVVSAAQLKSVVSEQRVAFDLEAKSLRYKLDTALQEMEFAKNELETLEVDSAEVQGLCMSDLTRVSNELSSRNAALAEAQVALAALEKEMTEFKSARQADEERLAAEEAERQPHRC
ncbi:hypothetical protein BE221DRAFT_2178 [Ostreococcus tauri]|uniref:Uncharacterized protein n=1 Tax=Ostreococcus tauri TaxID=70448 RepID=A0A1Y5HX03_OSTTA|nr:hypothetical protein BE221DRAFT_2178 [Ostreococcus tauri]